MDKKTRDLLTEIARIILQLDRRDLFLYQHKLLDILSSGNVDEAYEFIQEHYKDG